MSILDGLHMLLSLVEEACGPKREVSRLFWTFDAHAVKKYLGLVRGLKHLTDFKLLSSKGCKIINLTIIGLVNSIAALPLEVIAWWADEEVKSINEDVRALRGPTKADLGLVTNPRLKSSKRPGLTTGRYLNFRVLITDEETLPICFFNCLEPLLKTLVGEIATFFLMTRVANFFEPRKVL